MIFYGEGIFIPAIEICISRGRLIILWSWRISVAEMPPIFRFNVTSKPWGIVQPEHLQTHPGMYTFQKSKWIWGAVTFYMRKTDLRDRSKSPECHITDIQTDLRNRWNTHTMTGQDETVPADTLVEQRLSLWLPKDNDQVDLWSLGLTDTGGWSTFSTLCHDD